MRNRNSAGARGSRQTNGRDEAEENTRRQGRREDGPRNDREESARRIFGLVPVFEALKAGRRNFEEILIADGARDSRLRDLIELARSAGIPVSRVSRTSIGRDLEGVHQGVVAHVAATEYVDAGKVIDECAKKIAAGRAPLLTVLDGLEDPRNLGAILRTVECVGGDAVFIPERRAVGLTDVVAKTSAGAMEYVPVARAANISRLLEELKSIGIWIVGAAGESRTEYTEWDWTQPSALVLGSEGKGLHRIVREHCDTLVRIPLAGKIDSLNVSVAAGVVLFEAVRQRRQQSAGESSTET
jgi:23S rRNA (guanosine2251-2'-O)-methyltransferase